MSKVDELLSEGWSVIEDVMTNFDHSIEPWAEERLKSDKVVGAHTAWDFCGYVWFQDGKFQEEVWVSGSPQEVISAETLDDLMLETNAKYGSD